MSQVKASPTATQTQFALQQHHDQEQFNNITSGPVHRIMTRRASRSAQSHSTLPVIVKTPAEPETNENNDTQNKHEDNDDSVVSSNNNNTNDNNNTTTTTMDSDDVFTTNTSTTVSPRMTTRSRSIDLNQSNQQLQQHTNASSSAEESSNTSSTSVIATRRRKNVSKAKTKTKTKPRKRGGKNSLSPPVATSTSTTTKRRGEELRGSRRRNAKENNQQHHGAETTQLDAVKLKKLAELDELEKTILNGTHAEYRERMAHAEKKRTDEMKNAKLRRDLEEADIRYTFEAFKKAAYDQFYQCKAELRKRMISQVQAQIKRLEEEWHARHEDMGCSDDDDQELYDWVPHRHASIYIQPLGLNQEEILDDLTTARSKIYITESNN